MQFFEHFEVERRSVAVILGDLQTRLVEQLTDDDSQADEETDLPQQVSPEMLSYYLAFVREGASKENVSTRSKIMYQRLIAFEKDPRGTANKMRWWNLLWARPTSVIATILSHGCASAP